ncbi:hypothetical protein BSKO_10963 [Bryopsis sp. KO-2023]|nr:hypothetical protein BSKO_10963 [Bryopsis sp. KO-2023]
MDQYLLAFAAGAERDDLLEYFTSRCQAAHCNVEVASRSQGLLCVEASRLDLEVEATHMKLRKPLKNEAGKREDFEVESREDFQDVDSEDFFLPFEKAHITGVLLNSFKVDDQFMELASKHGWKGKNDHRVHFNSNLIISCKRLGFLESVTPIHRGKTIKTLWDKSKKSVLSPVTLYRDYFGEGVAYYWAWMNFYTLFLIAPAMVGLLIYIINRSQGWTVDDSPCVPFFSVFMVFWGALFMKCWKRKSNEFAFEWDTMEESKKDTLRPGFKGILLPSPITGELEPYYPEWKRFAKYAWSSVVTGLILMVAFVLMLMSLNLQGYITESNSWFYYPSLAQFSAEGEIFDPQGANMLLTLIPTFIHVAVIQTLNRIYRKVAEDLTEWENHKTEQSHENSLILKRFFFEAFDSYVALFYLAFYERDVLKVRRELVSLYTVDCIRRLGTECLLPILLQVIFGREVRREVQRLKSIKGETPSNLRALEDSRKDAYEEFDDYLEMVIEFGYVTMFASAYPLASFIQILYNLVEMKSDAFKLCFVCQRPPVARENGIGSWENVLKAQATLSVFTNVVLFAFSSDQMSQWFPSFFSIMDVDQDGDMDTVISQGKDRQVFLVMLVLEHILGLGVWLIFSCISDVPKSVEIATKRREYVGHQELVKAKKMLRKDVALKVPGSQELPSNVGVSGQVKQ